MYNRLIPIIMKNKHVIVNRNNIKLNGCLIDIFVERIFFTYRW